VAPAGDAAATEAPATDAPPAEAAIDAVPSVDGVTVDEGGDAAPAEGN
jgi:hypothetical protein